MKKYLLMFVAFVCFFSQTLSIQEEKKLHDAQSIKEELLNLYNTEPQFAPVFYDDAHLLLELQKMPASDGFWSWIKNYMNSNVGAPYFRVTAEKAPHTIEYLKVVAQKMGIQQLPDLYLGKSCHNPYNLNASSVFGIKTADLITMVGDLLLYYYVTEQTKEKWHIPILLTRIFAPLAFGMFLKDKLQTADRIVITDKKMIEYFSENVARESLTHECGHIKHQDYVNNTYIKAALFATCFVVIYYDLQKNNVIPRLREMVYSSTWSYRIMSYIFSFSGVISEKLMLFATTWFFAKHSSDIVMAHVIRGEEHRADLEAAHIVGFENAIKFHEEFTKAVEPNFEKDFSLVQPSDSLPFTIVHTILKKYAQLREWIYFNSPYRTHPTAQQRIDFLKKQQKLEQSAAV